MAQNWQEGVLSQASRTIFDAARKADCGGKLTLTESQKANLPYGMHWGLWESRLHSF